MCASEVLKRETRGRKGCGVKKSDKKNLNEHSKGIFHVSFLDLRYLVCFCPYQTGVNYCLGYDRFTSGLYQFEQTRRHGAKLRESSEKQCFHHTHR